MGGYRYCNVFGCREKVRGAGNKESAGVTFFQVPKGLLHEWQLAIPSSILKADSRICSRHFVEGDVLKGRTIGDTFFPFKRWQLRSGAIPKLLLNDTQDVHSSRHQTISRQPLKNKANSNQASGFVRMPKQSASVLERTVEDHQSHKQQQQKKTRTETTSGGTLHSQPAFMPNAVQPQAAIDEPNDDSAVQNDIIIEPMESSQMLGSVDSEDRRLPQTNTETEHQTPSCCTLNSEAVSAPNTVPPPIQSQLFSSRYTISRDAVLSNFKADFRNHLVLNNILELPPEWFIFCATGQRVVNVIHIDQSPDQNDSLLIKTIRIEDGQMVSYYINGDAVHPLGLERKFTSYEHFGELISAFHLMKKCSTITDESLIDFAENAPRLSCRKNKYGYIESTGCKLVAQKGRQCVKCRSLQKYILKQKREFKKRELQIKTKHYNIGKLISGRTQWKLENYRRKIRSLERKTKSSSTLIKELRRDYRILAAESKMIP